MQPGEHIASGLVAPGFERVHAAFERNFVATLGTRDIGAGLSVYHRGRLVVDLVGGVRDVETGSPWTPDTIANIWSSTKGVMAIAFARLVDRHLVCYEDKVADYWPEFAANGKSAITIREIMSHQAGLNGFREATTVDDFGDWPLVTARLAAQAPYWPPGTETSYHAMTQGFLIGEIVKRITGLEPREFVAREVALPLGADIQIGARDEDRHRLADIIPFDGAGTPETEDPLARPAVNNPEVRQDWANRPRWREAQVPAANGHASAAGLARLYGAIANGGVMEDALYLKPATIAALKQRQSFRLDRFLGARRWAHGVCLNSDGAWGPDDEAFGHSGWGGSFGCASPKFQVGIGYVMSAMGGQIASDPRATKICEAIFECLD